MTRLYRRKSIPILVVIGCLATAAITGGLIGFYMGFDLAYFAVLVAIVVLIIWPWLSMASDSDLFEPKRFFPLLIGFFSMPALLGIYLTANDLEIDFDPFYVYLFGERLDEITFLAALLCLVGLGAFYFGYSLSIGLNLAQKIPVSKWQPSPTKLALVSLTMLGLSFALTMRFVEEFGGLGSYLELGYAQVRATSDVPTILAASIGLTASSICLVYFSARILKKNYLLLVALGVIALYAVYMISVGNRRALLFLAIALLVFEYYYRPNRPRVITVALVLMVFSALLSAVGDLRARSAADYSEQIEAIVPRLFSLALTGPLRSAEGQAPFLAFPTLLRAVPDRVQYRFGTTYFQWIPALIPRSIWPSKPPSLTMEYMKAFHPGSAQGFAFFFLAESVWNFGVAGPVIIMFAAGIILRTVYEAFRRNAFKPDIILVYSLFVAFLPSMIRTDSTSLAEFAREYLLPIVVGLAFANARTRKQIQRRRIGGS